MKKINFKLPSPSKQDIVDWVEKAHKALSSDKEMVAKTFEVLWYQNNYPRIMRS